MGVRIWVSKHAVKWPLRHLSQNRCEEMPSACNSWYTDGTSATESLQVHVSQLFFCSALQLQVPWERLNFLHLLQAEFRRSQILNAVQGTCFASSAPVRTRLDYMKGQKTLCGSTPPDTDALWGVSCGHPFLSRDLLAACWSPLAHPRC